MKTRIIESEQNDDYRAYLELLTSKGIREQNRFFLSGKKIIAEFLNDPYLQKKFRVSAQILQKGMQALSVTNAPITEMPAPLFKNLDVIGTHSPLLLLETPAIKTWSVKNEFADFVLVLPLGDPANLGATLRSAEAFGVQDVLLTQETAHPYLPKSLKASSGSALRLNLQRGPSLEEFLRLETELLSPLWTLDLEGVSLEQMRWPKKMHLVVGEERGLPFKSAHRLTIPTQGVESLSAPIATSVALYERSRVSK